MDIKNLRLGTFKLILRELLDSARNNDSPDFGHLKITYSWVKYETDEDVFELLKQGYGGDYMRKVIGLGGKK